MMGLLKIWLSSWLNVQSEVLAAAELAGRTGATSMGSRAFAFINSVASSGTMGVAMLSVTLTTVVSTASVVYDVVLDPESTLQVQETVFDSGVITDDEGNYLPADALLFAAGSEQTEHEQMMSLQEVMQAVHDPDKEHTEFMSWVPDEQWMIDSGLWTEDEVMSILESLGLLTSDSGTDKLSSPDGDTPAPIESLVTTPEPTPEEPPEPPPAGSSTVEPLIAPPSLPATITLPSTLPPPPPFTPTQPPALPPPPTEEIIIITHPTASTTVNEGEIWFGLTVTASGPGALNYQWYRNTTNSNSGGTPIPNGAIHPHILSVPWDLKVGTHYFYVVISAEGTETKTSNVAIVIVTQPPPPILWSVTIEDGGTGFSGSGLHQQGRTVTISAGTRPGFIFNGWTVTSGNTTLANPANPNTMFVMPEGDVTVKANWVTRYNVTIDLDGGSGPSVSGQYLAGETVTLNAGTRDGLAFFRWHVMDAVSGFIITMGVDMVDPTSANTTFIMPATHVIVTATWAQQYMLTIEGGGMGATASGLRTWDALVELDPGTRPGLIFDGWTTDPVIDLHPYTNPDNPTATLAFRMPNHAVTITANWEPIPPPPPVVVIDTQPVATTTLIQGNITPSTTPLLVLASVVPDITLTYQWYSNTTNDNTGGTLISLPFSTPLFPIPVTLTEGIYYYYVVVSAPGAEPVRSNVATVIITLPPPPPQFDVTVNLNGGNGPSVNGSYEAGDTVYLNAGTRDGWTLTGWTALPTSLPPLPITVTPIPLIPVPGVPPGSTHAFLMPAFDVTVTANWIENAPPPVPVITITTQPAATSTLVQGSITPSTTPLLVLASVVPDVTLTYQWYSNTTNDNTGGTLISLPFSTPLFPIPVALTEGIYYYYVVVSAPGAESVTSDTATVIIIPPPTQYTVTVVSDGEGSSGGGSYLPGATVLIEAGSRPGWTFVSFNSSPSISVALGPIIPGFPITGLFTMPESDVTITVNWEENASPSSPDPPEPPPVPQTVELPDLLNQLTEDLPIPQIENLSDLQSGDPPESPVDPPTPPTGDPPEPPRDPPPVSPPEPPPEQQTTKPPEEPMEPAAEESQEESLS